MSMPISVRLDDAVRAELEQAAQKKGQPLSSLVRDALTDLGQQMRRARIGKASDAVAARAAADPKAQAFLADWGTPTVDV
jgi:predicted transcriptional regulator